MIRMPFNAFSQMATSLYPILWRQVRREMASTPYKIMLCLLHLSLVLVAFSAIASDKVADSGMEPMLFFGGMFLFFILPVGSLGALKEERLGNRADLLLISGLGPRTIVYGHWIAQCSKIVPVVASVVPYLLTVLMISSTNVGVALQVAGLSLLATCFLLALGVCLSVIENNIAKGVLVVVLLFTVPSVMSGLASVRLGIGYNGFLYILWYLPLVPVLMEIASITFQLPSQRQLLVVQLGVLYFGVLGFSSGFLSMDLLPFFLAFLCAAALMFLEPVYRRVWASRWQRGGRVSRVLGFVTSGGWPGGVAFVLALACAGAIFSQMNWFPATSLAMGSFIVMGATFLLPLAVALRLRPRHSLAFRYLISQLAFMLVTSLLLILAEMAGVPRTLSELAGVSPVSVVLSQLVALLPHAGLMAVLFGNEYGRYGVFFALVGMIPFLLALLLLRKPLRAKWRTWQETCAAAAAHNTGSTVPAADSVTADAG